MMRTISPFTSTISEKNGMIVNEATRNIRSLVGVPEWCHCDGDER